ncbi:MOSC domain-containing protein [Brevibacterium atlanticum]|uniref:MOSC domain-containing protein n=1 Tax=Brevibacterium atlanticum TaxID=2697563 RepID=UPI001D189971|nr:MOSC domain-containing protein [Brevibacterium atlanticum]
MIDSGGPVGDREFCLVDVENRRVLKTVQNPRLIQIATSLVRGGGGGPGSGGGGRDGSGSGGEGAELTMALPDGRSVRGVPRRSGERLTCDYWKRPVDLELTEGPHSDLASEWLGTTVRLARAPRGAVVYGSPVSILTTASLRDLSRRMAQSHPDSPDLVAQAARFRATFVIDTDEPYVEEEWAGQTVSLGDVSVRIGTPIPRCAVMDLDPLTGERNAPVLKTLAGYRPRNATGEPLFGVYADVL